MRLGVLAFLGAVAAAWGVSASLRARSERLGALEARRQNEELLRDAAAFAREHDLPDLTLSVRSSVAA